MLFSDFFSFIARIRWTQKLAKNKSPAIFGIAPNEAKNKKAAIRFTKAANR
ncbi:hypothetical protein [Enterococcus casseliflavus]|uniref:hypothetical protein n=1 Tax=Enterococcus casseliflavus TaxID=37734 RepID=UPI002897E10C|nr:hypothetical protein [Enterococcus casseliflavus]